MLIQPLLLATPHPSPCLPISSFNNQHSRISSMRLLHPVHVPPRGPNHTGAHATWRSATLYMTHHMS
jgi:hypothetical protein